jgi:hypothetical protein
MHSITIHTVISQHENGAKVATAWKMCTQTTLLIMAAQNEIQDRQSM